jgi:hypothetical protein
MNANEYKSDEASGGRTAIVQRLADVFTETEVRRITEVCDRSPRLYDIIMKMESSRLRESVRSMIIIDPACRCGHDFRPSLLALPKSDLEEKALPPPLVTSESTSSESASIAFETEFQACVKRYLPNATDQLITNMLDAIYKEENLDFERRRNVGDVDTKGEEKALSESEPIANSTGSEQRKSIADLSPMSASFLCVAWILVVVAFLSIIWLLHVFDSDIRRSYELDEEIANLLSDGN